MCARRVGQVRTVLFFLRALDLGGSVRFSPIAPVWEFDNCLGTFYFGWKVKRFESHLTKLVRVCVGGNWIGQLKESRRNIPGEDMNPDFWETRSLPNIWSCVLSSVENHNRKQFFFVEEAARHVFFVRFLRKINHCQIPMILHVSPSAVFSIWVKSWLLLVSGRDMDVHVRQIPLKLCCIKLRLRGSSECRLPLCWSQHSNLPWGLTKYLGWTDMQSGQKSCPFWAYKCMFSCKTSFTWTCVSWLSFESACRDSATFLN